MESSRISVKGSRRVILPSRVPPCARYFAFVASLLILLLFIMFRGGENRNSRRRTESAVQVVHSIYGQRDTTLTGSSRPNVIPSSTRAMKYDTFPAVIIAGVPKGGTTDLFHVLPQLGLGIIQGEKKEPGFFNKPGDSWDAYRMSLLNGSQSGPGVYTIDGTPSYVLSPIAGERIAKYSKDSKIIVLLRDPYERALSHYVYWRGKGTFLENDPDFNTFCMEFKIKVAEAAEVFSKAHAEASDGHLDKDVYTQVYNAFNGTRWKVFTAGLYRYALLNFFNFVDPKNVMIAGSEVMRDRVPGSKEIVSFLLDDPSFEFSESQLEILGERKRQGSRNPKPTVSATCQEFLRGFYRHHNDNLFSVLQALEKQGARLYGVNNLEWLRKFS